jgi:hypothetical protein
MIWLGSERGALTDWVTQQWVIGTGRRVHLADAAWLDGPIGGVTRIGARFFQGLARASGMVVATEGARQGRVDDLSDLAGPSFNPAEVHPDVRGFYEQTALYELDAWSEWTPAFRPFAALLAVLHSRRLQQLNLPLSPLDASRGTTSEIIRLVDPAGIRPPITGWVRTLRRSGHMLYAGAYSIATPPGLGSPCVRVVFPLPTGNAVVLLKPSSGGDGSLVLISAGIRFGDPGFYFTVHRPGRVWARYVRAIQEDIRVYPVGGGEVRADHSLRLWRRVFLRIHYRLRRG